MYFHEVKSTAHPPFIGALGHSTNCIVKQSYTFEFVQACRVLLEEKLHLQTIKHTDIRKFNVRPACLLLLFLSVLTQVYVRTADELMCLSKISRVASSTGKV